LASLEENAGGSTRRSLATDRRKPGIVRTIVDLSSPEFTHKNYETVSALLPLLAVQKKILYSLNPEKGANQNEKD
jgi:hypothetical protein